MSKKQSRPYNYPEIGATKRTDTPTSMRRGYRASEERIHIGSGQRRWEHAWKETLSWGIQRKSGYTVLPIHPPQPHPGAPSAPHAAEPTPELAREGMEVLLQKRFGPLRLKMPVRVVYTIDEPARKGFAFGTLKGHPVSGEAAFIVQRNPDDSVWFTLRSLSGPGKGLWLFAHPMVLLLRTGIRNSYINALAGPIS